MDTAEKIEQYLKENLTIQVEVDSVRELYHNEEEKKVTVKLMLNGEVIAEDYCMG